MQVGAHKISSGTTRQLLVTVLLVFAVNALSAVFFMHVVRRPVYDDPFNMFDVHAYATNGISLASIQDQRNAPGPTSFIWMSLAVRLIGHNELLDARIASLFSWLLVTALTILLARRSSWPNLWYAALLAALVFPHCPSASATALTEGPALLFALVGVLAWTDAVCREDRSRVLAIVGGLSMGLAVTCRQYYLALLPAAGLVALLLLKATRPPKQKLRWFAGVVLSLGFAMIPVLIMLFVWRGITSPSMASGTSYVGYQAGMGVAWFRPIVVIFYTLLYLVPFSFPSMFRTPWARSLPAILLSSLVGIVAVNFRSSLLDPGPVHSLVEAASRIPAGSQAVFWLMVSIATYNAITVCLHLWRERLELFLCPPVVFALLVVLFFVVEQIGVGGNIPFYDRYVLQVAPFLGLVGFWVFPKLTYPRILALAGLSIVGQTMLWRYAFVK